MKRIRKFLTSGDFAQCLECLKSFKEITHTHLKLHNLSLNQYRKKYNLFRGELFSRNTRLKLQTNAFRLIAEKKLKPRNSVKKLSKIKYKKLHKKLNRIRSIVSLRMWEPISSLKRSIILRNNSLKRWTNVPFYKRKEHMIPASKSHIGKPAWNRGLKLSPLSDEQKFKISKKLKGVKFTKVHCNRISKSLKGRIFTVEHRKNISLAKSKINF